MKKGENILYAGMLTVYLFFSTKLLKWVNRYAENSQQIKILSGQKNVVETMGETSLNGTSFISNSNLSNPIIFKLVLTFYSFMCVCDILMMCSFRNIIVSFIFASKFSFCHKKNMLRYNFLSVLLSFLFFLFAIE